MAACDFVLHVLLAAVPPLAGADQTQTPNYATSRDKKSCPLYVDARPNQSTDIYCGLRLKVDPDNPQKRSATWLGLERAYPAQWTADALGCPQCVQCRQDPDATIKERFNHAEGDLHNLFPAVQSLNSARGERLYGLSPGTETRGITIGTKDLHLRSSVRGGRGRASTCRQRRPRARNPLHVRRIRLPRRSGHARSPQAVEQERLADHV